MKQRSIPKGCPRNWERPAPIAGKYIWHQKRLAGGAAPRPCHHARRTRQEAQHTARFSNVRSRLRSIHLICIETTDWVKCSLLAALVTPPSSATATNERNVVRSRFRRIKRLPMDCCTIDHFSFWMALNIIINISIGFKPSHNEIGRIKECHQSFKPFVILFF